MDKLTLVNGNRLKELLEKEKRYETALNSIASMPFRSDKPYKLMDAVEVAFEAVQKPKVCEK